MLDYLLPKLAGPSILAIGMLSDAAMSSPDYVGGLTNLTGYGLVGWVVHHMFTKVLPDKDKLHAEEMKQQRESHAATIVVLTTEYTACLKQQRSDLLGLREQK